MEKPPLKPSKGNRILKLLPKGTSFSIPNQPYSPGREKAHAARRGFSGPLFAPIPAEARSRPSGPRGGFETPEPTSPKVSCIGQIKHKSKKACKSKPSASTRTTDRKPRFSLRRMFSGKAKKVSLAGGSSCPEPRAHGKPPPVPGRAAPPLGQMRRFASGRETLANFDWRASRVADEWGEDFSDDYMDNGFSDRDNGFSDDEEEHVKIPHSAPMLLGGGAGAASVAMEPRKEVNLWKRRTMAPPSPLDLE